MDDHVTTDLAPVKTVIPDFEGRDEFEGDDMENVDVERVVAAIDHKTLYHAVVAVKP